MSTLRIRENVRGYVRDTYLGIQTEYNPSYPVIDCAIGSSQWGIAERASDALRDHHLKAQTAYPEMFYDKLLKPAILERFKIEGLKLDHVFFGHGSFNLAERLIHKLIEPGIMLGVGPQFNEIPSEFVAAGGSYLPVPIQEPDYAFPLKTLKDALKNGVSVLYLDNPNNPLGRLIGLKTLSEIVRVANQEGIIVIIDEAYADFVDDNQSAANLISHFPNIAVLRSFSKGLGLAAARIGYMFLSSELAHYYRMLDVPFEPSLLSAVLARATLEDSAFIRRVRINSTNEKCLLLPLIQEAGFTVLPTHPSTSILTAHRSDCDIVASFASVSIAVEPGSAFQRTHPAWDNSYCRLRLPQPSDINEFKKRLIYLKENSYAY